MGAAALAGASEMVLILVLGLSGVGKSFVCSKATDILKGKKKSFEIVNYGDVIGEVMGKDPDLFRDITSKKEYSDIQFKAAKRIVKDYGKKDILLTTHGIMETRYGFVFGLVPRVLDMLKPSLIFVVWMQEKRIYEHLERDKGKANRENRETFSLEQIKEMQELEKEVSIQYGFYSDCPVKFVENIERKVDKAAEEIADTILEVVR